uniref:Uncharacterized protein n=1 Tax=Panagrolaimus sp. ES5 TaxID=591445 RepID=A0AC34G0W6_9BILA
MANIIGPYMLQEIKRLADGTDEDCLEVCETLLGPIFSNGKCADPSVIDDLLPIFINFLKAKNVEIQKEGIFFTTAVTTTSKGELNEEYFTLKVIEAGAIEALLNLLFSKDHIVLRKTFVCLNNIGVTYSNIIIQKCKDFGTVRLGKRCNELCNSRKVWIKHASRAFLNKYIIIVHRENDDE